MAEKMPARLNVVTFGVRDLPSSAFRSRRALFVARGFLVQTPCSGVQCNDWGHDPAGVVPEPAGHLLAASMMKLLMEGAFTSV